MLIDVNAALVSPAGLWRSWTAEPGVIAPLAVTAALYARLVVVARRRGARVFPWPNVIAFACGWLALVLALVSPLDGLGETLFAAHMAQHLLMMTVAAPLLVLGAPPAAWLWVLPAAQRKHVARWWSRARGIRAVARGITNPPIVLASQTAALWFWHFPRPYEAALRTPALHALEHASFLGTAVLFWWVTLHPFGRRRLGFGAAILYVGVTLCQSGALGALLMFSPTAWYASHAAGAKLWGISALEDQQLAGLIMWIPAGVVYVLAAAFLFVKWMKADERAVRTLVAASIAGVSIGCSASPHGTQHVDGGSAKRGQIAIARAGCGACHDIPGIRTAHGVTGPSLDHWSQRGIIAGKLPNTPDQLISWIASPQSIEPGNAMPDMGISQTDARDIAAYLYAIK